MDLHCDYHLLQKRQKTYSERIIRCIPIEKSEILLDLDFVYTTSENVSLFNFNNDTFNILYTTNINYQNFIRFIGRSTNDYEYFGDVSLDIYQYSDAMTKYAMFLLMNAVNKDCESFLNMVTRDSQRQKT